MVRAKGVSSQECGPGEVVVPRHCRAKSARANRPSDNAQLRASLAELQDDIQPRIDDIKPKSNAQIVLDTLIRTIDRSPGFIVSAVDGMNALRAKIPDVDARYKEVTRAIRDEDGFLGRSTRIKHAVFTMLLTRRSKNVWA